MDKKKFNELVAQKQLLEGKIKAVREHKRRSSLSYLIEDVIAKAEVALVAQSIADKIAKMAEDMAKIEGDDLMPMMDSLKAAFGPGMAETFQKTITDRIRAGTANMTQLKDAVSGEVSKLEAVANGKPPVSDMASDDLADPAAAPAPGLDDVAQPDAVPALDAPAGGEPDLAALGADGDIDNPATGSPVGRARKESVARKGKALTEGLLDSIKSVLSAHFDDVSADRSAREQLEALKPFITASDYEVASQFPDHLLAVVFDRGEAAVGIPAGMEVGMPDATVGGAPVPAMGSPEPEMDMDGEIDPLDPVDPLEGGLAPLHGEMDAAGLPATIEPTHDDIGMPFESVKRNAKRLAESKNPDATILSVYQRVVREGVKPSLAARKVSEAFGIDYRDVVQVVREAAEAKKDEVEKAKPGKDWSKLYNEVKDDGLTMTAIVKFITDESKDEKADKSGIRAWVKDKMKVVESAKQDAIFGKKDEKKSDKKDKDCKDEECDREEVDERADPSVKKIGLDRHLQRKLAAAKDEKGKVDPKKNPFGKTEEPKKVAEGEGDKKFKVQAKKSGGDWVDVSGAPTFATKEEAASYGRDHGKGPSQYRGVPVTTKKVEEAEGDVGFQAAIATPVKYPEASNPAFKSNSGKGGSGTDKTEKPMVVGGNINPAKGDPKSAGKMAGAKVAEGEGDTGFPVVSNKAKGFPEAENPGFKKNTKQSGKNDPAGKSPVVGKAKVAEADESTGSTDEQKYAQGVKAAKAHLARNGDPKADSSYKDEAKDNGWSDTLADHRRSVKKK